MQRCIFISTLLCSLALSCAPAVADDWPQWLGPRRDSTWHETGILAKFPAAGPKIVWRVPIAGGYAGPAVANGRVFVTDYERSTGEAKNDPGSRPKLQGRERVWCLDAATGKTLWKYEYDCPYEISYPAGPRATPTVDGDRVYVLGAQGHFTCLRADTGAVVWQIQLAKQYRAPTPIWGFCSHPLVDGDKVYTLAGGEGSVAVALDKLTGREIWRALSATDAGYAPPTMIEAAERKQLVVWHPQAVNGLDPETGKEFWSVKLDPDYGMSINAPRQVGEYLYVGGIKDKGVMLRLAPDRPAVSEVWRASNKLGFGPVHSPVVPVGDILFGVNRGGELTAIEIATGKRLWETFKPTTGATRFVNSGSGFLVLNGDRFYIMSETGALVIARLSAEGYQELDRAQILEPTHEAFGRNVLWSHPAFAGRAMFARNDKEIVCVSLAE